MVEVDPRDDSVRRFVVNHHRYDPARRERRDVDVAAYDTEADMVAHLERLATDIEERRRAGLTDHREQASGSELEAGHARKQANARFVTRAFRHGVVPPNLDTLDLPANMAVCPSRTPSHEPDPMWAAGG